MSQGGEGVWNRSASGDTIDDGRSARATLFSASDPLQANTKGRPNLGRGRPFDASGAAAKVDELAATVRVAGFEVVLARALPSSAWDEYYGPMLETLAELRREDPDDPEVEAWARE